MPKFAPQNELDALLGPECPVLRCTRKLGGLSQSLRDRLETEYAEWDTSGQKLAGADAAYRAARREWSNLPIPVLEQLTETWALAGVTSDADWDVSLSDFIESELLRELGEDLLVQFHGRNARMQVKALSGFGRRWLTTAYGTGRSLGSTMREIVQTLWAFRPEPTESDRAETLAHLEAA